MKIIDVRQNTDEWLNVRKGKISGTILGDLYGVRGGRKIGFYQVIAERLGLDPDGENRMDRGLRLEEEAAQLFADTYDYKLEQVGVCVSELDDRIINSPDRLIKSRGRYTKAVEIKCLSPARHLQAVIENQVPREFDSQVAQYFIVNENLNTLYVVFYDPRITSKPFWVIDVHRDDIQDRISRFTDWQLLALKEMDEIVEELAF